MNHILVALGYRQQGTPEVVAPKPPPGKAWLSVKLQRKEAVGPVDVFLGTPGTPDSFVGPIEQSKTILPMIAVITGKEAVWPYFFADRSRVPHYGGHVVDKDALIAIRIIGTDGAKPLQRDWGPYPVAAGAVIDVLLEL